MSDTKFVRARDVLLRAEAMLYPPVYLFAYEGEDGYFWMTKNCPWAIGVTFGYMGA